MHSDDGALAVPRWKMSWFALVPTICGLVGLLLASYPVVSSWFSQYNQSQVVRDYQQEIDDVEPDKAEQIDAARQYNAALTMGAVLGANTNVPIGEGGSADKSLDYDSTLRANEAGLMGRIRIPSIDVDLPIYHGTDAQTLLEGAGHLQGTSLPVGGIDTRTVITAHRGLPNAEMFTQLDKVRIGDTFTLEVFGEVLTYRVRDRQIVEPEDTESLRVEPGSDLATLVTCTPLGVNSHRILLTGERVEPTPQEDIDAAGGSPEVPRFPWWALWIPAGVGVLGFYFWWAGRPVHSGRRPSVSDGMSSSLPKEHSGRGREIMDETDEPGVFGEPG